MNASRTSPNFLEDVVIYASRMRLFQREDWFVYFMWVGLLSGLLVSVGGFVVFGWTNGVEYPAYVWNIPAGIGIFILAIAFDTIGHRTVYKAELQKGEALVHHITIFAGVTSCILLCLAYSRPDAFRIPSIALTALSMFYSGIDEALHWRRYLNGVSDRVEMWSHFFIFVGHSIMMLAWCYWFLAGYPGVAATLALF